MTITSVVQQAMPYTQRRSKQHSPKSWFSRIAPPNLRAPWSTGATPPTPRIIRSCDGRGRAAHDQAGADRAGDRARGGVVFTPRGDGSFCAHVPEPVRPGKQFWAPFPSNSATVNMHSSDD